MKYDAEILNRLRVALEANSQAYRRTVQTSAPGDCWDVLVLTAANEKQAEGYRQELALRHRAAGPAGSFFPAIQKSLVVADPGGRRAGSGGATMHALKAVVEHLGVDAESLRQLRILVIHSGGASQRLPAYSALGKIFAPLPLLRPDGQICTLFDHLYVTLAGLAERLGPGMLIVAGDVFLLFDHRHVGPPAPGITAITMRVEAELGTAHGVWVVDSTGCILRTLQKATTDQMRQAGALDQRGLALIDTGLLFFDPERTLLLAGLAGALPDCTSNAAGAPVRRQGAAGLRGAGDSVRGLHRRFVQPIDLYEDITGALAAETSFANYIADPHRRALRNKLWSALHGVPFRAMPVDGHFLHLGTTRQFRDVMVGLSPSPATELFQQNLLVSSPARLPRHCRAYHCAFLGRGPGRSGMMRLGRSCLVEHSILSSDCRIGAGSVVSQVVAVREPVRVPDNLLLFQVPVRTSAVRPAAGAHPRRRSGVAPDDSLLFVHVLCGIEDDFKGRWPECHFLNRPISEFLHRHGLKPADIWPDTPPERRTLWTARLFPGSPQRDAARCVLDLVSGQKPGRGGKAIQKWKACARFSMAMLLEQADPQCLIEHRETVAAHLQASALIEALRQDRDDPVESFIGHYTTAGAQRACLEHLLRFASSSADWPPLSRHPGSRAWRRQISRHRLRQSRAFWCAAQLMQRADQPLPDARQQAEHFMNQAFAKVAEASEIACVGAGRAGPPVRRLVPGLRIEAASPVRLDLAGGWSDTPPYCYERGGHVVNVAIDLDNHPPVRAMVRTIRQPVVILESHDLGTHLELTRIEPLDRSAIMRDPFALHKVALEMTGLLPPACPGPAVSLSAHMRRLGAGLIVSTECRVPKGSGLGTSSILAATLLAALHETIGQPTSHGRLISETLLLEQRLSTGGGWQDQVGGIVGGIKSTTTAPGVPQQPAVESIELSESLLTELQDRLVVYYSGQQRLARDILRRVMGRYLAREPAILVLMEELKRSAARLRQAIIQGRWARAAREIGLYWEFKKQLYPGSTTPTIDVLFLEMRPYYLAAGLAGAGGGGFAYFFCKDARQAARLRQELGRWSARPGWLGALFQAQINRTGLCVTRRTS